MSYYRAHLERQIGDLWRAIAIENMHHRRDCARVLDSAKCDCELGRQLDEVVALERYRNKGAG